MLQININFSYQNENKENQILPRLLIVVKLLVIQLLCCCVGTVKVWLNIMILGTYLKYLFMANPYDYEPKNDF